MTYISWVSDFALYLEDFLMYKHDTEQNRAELYSIEIILRPHAGGIREHVRIYLTAAIWRQRYAIEVFCMLELATENAKR